MLFLKRFYWVSVFLAGALGACGDGNSKQSSLEDEPADVYSLIKEDTVAGIDIVSVSGCNPVEVRKRILAMDIPEQSYVKKRAVFYGFLDQLYRLRDTSGGEIAYVIDSLNYMAIRYLEDMLLDEKSLSNPPKHAMLGAVSSFDKRVTVYAWKDNLGVDLELVINVIQYRLSDATLRVLYLWEHAHNEDIDFACSRINTIYRLKTDQANPLYLFNFTGNNGGKKNFKGSAVVEMIDEDLDFTYKAFEDVDEYYILQYAQGEDVHAVFYPKTQILQYTFRNQEWKHRTIFLFDGHTFRKQPNPT
jgi:hypothetical protein